MTIPFVDLVKSVKARLFPAAEPSKSASASPVRAEKGKGERLRKTVLPKANATRATTAVETRQGAAGSGSTEKAPASPAPPAISFNPVLKWAGSPELRNTAAQAPQPYLERVISLQISDILDQLPSDQIKPHDDFDAARAIVLKGSEIEKGMASGKPSVSLASIYHQAPEIFLHPVPPDDCTLVPLPFNKVLEQFERLQVRSDQVSDPDVPQLETPFLKITLEDTERFGTAIKPLQTSPHPPVKIEPATAKTIAAAEPEPAVRETARSTSVPVVESSHEKRESDPTVAAPRKIPFHLPPNGTGASASEKVPASSGPPVPTVPMPATPRRIPLTNPSEELRPKFTLVPGVEPKPAPAEPSATVAQTGESGSRDRRSRQQPSGTKIALPLQPLLQALPAFQLNGSPMTVGEDVRAEFPLSLIEPQLASGRVVIPAKAFQGAIPQMHRELFVIDPNETPVSLPLQDILERLPPTALRMRDDQEEAVIEEKFTTPFSLQAEEDAKHFEAMAAAALKVSAEPAKEESIKEDVQSSTSITPHSIEAEPYGPKVVIASACALSGVKACAITFADGLSLAGNLPAELVTEGVCAMAPPFLHKLDNHLVDAKLGALRAMTVHCEKAALTFFQHDNICLTALHSEGQELAAETRDQLAVMVRELSRVYSQPELPHVDH